MKSKFCQTQRRIKNKKLADFSQESAFFSENPKNFQNDRAAWSKSRFNFILYTYESLPPPLPVQRYPPLFGYQNSGHRAP